MSEIDEYAAKGSKDWPHAPPHRLAESGVYFLTSRTRDGKHLLAEDEMKDWFQAKLKELAKEYGWKLEAWAILSNHYHFVAHSPDGEDSAKSLKAWVQKLHSQSTKEINRRDKCPGRSRLWQNFRETRLTHQKSYLARLHYVHQNAVHHGLVRKGTQWKWCSASEFVAAVSPAWVRTVASFRYEEIANGDGE